MHFGCLYMPRIYSCQSSVNVCSIASRSVLQLQFSSDNLCSVLCNICSSPKFSETSIFYTLIFCSVTLNLVIVKCEFITFVSSTCNCFAVKILVTLVWYD